MASPLVRFLAQARSAALRPTTPPTYYTLVLGNPSCDLDSFICATIYSFFHSHQARRSPSPQPHLYIPLLNLPSTSSGELWRLRPEFGTALRLALHGHDQGGNAEDDREEAEVNKSLLGNLVTISDIRSCASSRLNYVFSKPGTTTQPPSEGKIRVLLVDHNALSIPLPGISPSEISSRLDVVGCIDHHIDESSIPTSASPRIIRTGVGSCTTLVVQYLKDEGFWDDLLNPAATSPNEEDGGGPAAGELAKLSLAAILDDTVNLTGEGKVSDLDRQAVGFLEEIITNSSSASSHQETPQASRDKAAAKWDRKSCFEQIAATRADSLSLLSLPEIFNRDYKAWSEKATGNSPDGVGQSTMHLGIAGIVKPVSWLIKKADGSSVQNFVSAMGDFATRQDPRLDLFAIMTVPAHAGRAFQRELILLDTGRTEASRRVVDKFQEIAGEELRLEDWEEDQGLARALDREEGGGDGNGDGDGDGDGDGGGRGGALKGRIWWQRDGSKSRKVVAPLLREAMRRV